MASKIKIKRSGSTAVPVGGLGQGELAYSWLSNSLYIGTGTETDGIAANIDVIGGKVFIDKLDHANGTLTASSAIVVDSNSKIDILNVDNLTLDGNTLSSTNVNGNIVLDPNGTGEIQLSSNVAVSGNLTVTGTINATISGNADTATKWATPRDLTISGDATALFDNVDGATDVNATLTLATVNTSVGTFGSSTSIPVVTVNAKGLVTAVTTASISTTLTISGNSGNDNVALGTDTLTITGSGAISTVVTDNTVTISAADATTSSKGIASFSSTDFSVTSGAVSLNSESIQDIVGGMVSSNTESGIAVTYDDDTGKLNFNVNDPTITIDGDVDGSAVMTDLGNTTITVTLDTVLDNTTNKVPGTFGSSSAIPVVTVDAKGRVTAITTESISTALTIAGDTGTADTVSLGVDTFTIAGGEGIDTVVSNNTITISGEDATSSNKGIASFNTASFTVTAGDVTVKAGGISNSQLVNSSVTFGSTTVALGSASTTIAGVTELTVDNLNFNGNEITSTNTNGDISLNPAGSGTVAVNGARITGLAEPTAADDAATKAYVDAAAEGLAVKPAVKAATTENLTATYDNGTAGVGATLTATANGAFPTIDGVSTWALFNGILVKDQTNKAENGRYFISQLGNGSTPWILTRCSKCDEPSEIPSMYVFVQEGTLYNSTGWVATVDTLPLIVGTGEIVFTQFSGAGTYLAGDGLDLTGSTFKVNVAANGGIEISADALQLKSSIAGNGLTFVDGVLAVGGTADRITVSTDAIDIAATYVGQTSITTLGTVTTGTWSATAIGTTKGGTGLTSYTTGDLLYASSTDTLSKLAAGTLGKVLQIDATGVPVWGDIDGGTY
jgi:hypothetical protein